MQNKKQPTVPDDQIHSKPVYHPTTLPERPEQTYRYNFVSLLNKDQLEVEGEWIKFPHDDKDNYLMHAWTGLVEMAKIYDLVPSVKPEDDPKTGLRTWISSRSQEFHDDYMNRFKDKDLAKQSYERFWDSTRVDGASSVEEQTSAQNSSSRPLLKRFPAAANIIVVREAIIMLTLLLMNEDGTFKTGYKDKNGDSHHAYLSFFIAFEKLMINNGVRKSGRWTGQDSHLWALYEVMRVRAFQFNERVKGSTESESRILQLERKASDALHQEAEVKKQFHQQQELITSLQEKALRAEQAFEAKKSEIVSMVLPAQHSLQTKEMELKNAKRIVGNVYQDYASKVSALDALTADYQALSLKNEELATNNSALASMNTSLNEHIVMLENRAQYLAEALHNLYEFMISWFRLITGNETVKEAMNYTVPFDVHVRERPSSKSKDRVVKVLKNDAAATPFAHALVPKTVEMSTLLHKLGFKHDQPSEGAAKIVAGLPLTGPALKK
jgi:hypothetical protein